MALILVLDDGEGQSLSATFGALVQSNIIQTAADAAAAAASATAAANSATGAAASATSASNSANAAANSATNAATSATNSANSATSAANSASTANSAATSASTSATNAANSASSAATSATNAANSLAALNSEYGFTTTGGTTTLTTNQAASGIIVVSGALTSNAVIVMPATPHRFAVNNQTTGNYSVTIQASGQVPSVQALQGKATPMYADATGVFAEAATTGVQFAGLETNAGNITLNISHLGTMFEQLSNGGVTTLPLASTYPAGAGVAIKDLSATGAKITTQGADTCELATPYSTTPQDVFYMFSDGVSAWKVGIYANAENPTFSGTVWAKTAVKYADGTTQTTANSASPPASTIYSVSQGNATLGASSITTTGYIAPFVVIYRNGIKLINGTDWSYSGDNKTLNLTSPIGKNDQFEVLTQTIISPTTAYAPQSSYFTPAAGATSISVNYTVGFVFAYVNGSRFVPGVDFTATDGATINFPNYVFDGNVTVEIWAFQPLTFTNSVNQNAPVINAPLVFADGSSQGTAAPGRNRIINGACRVAQYGSTSFASGTGGYGGPDRWNAANENAGGQFTQSQYSATYNGQPKLFVQQTCNTPPADLSGVKYWCGISQKIEGFNCADLIGQKVTVSFKFLSNVTGTFSISLLDGGAANSVVSTFTATAGVITPVTITFPAIPATASIPNSNAIGLTLHIGFLNNGSYQTTTLNAWQSGAYNTSASATNWGLTAGNYIAATDIKLEAGGAATPMEPRLYQEELAACQRYYETGIQPASYCDAIPSGSAAAYGDLRFAVTKRTNPTIVMTGWQYYSGGVNASFTPGLQFNYPDKFVFTGTGLTNWRGWVGVGTWTANAEL